MIFTLIADITIFALFLSCQTHQKWIEIKILLYRLKLITLIKPDKQNYFFAEIEAYSINGEEEEKKLYSK